MVRHEADIPWSGMANQEPIGAANMLSRGSFGQKTPTCIPNRPFRGSAAIGVDTFVRQYFSDLGFFP